MAVTTIMAVAPPPVTTAASTRLSAAIAPSTCPSTTSSTSTVCQPRHQFPEVFDMTVDDGAGDLSVGTSDLSVAPLRPEGDISSAVAAAIVHETAQRPARQLRRRVSFHESFKSPSCRTHCLQLGSM